MANIPLSGSAAGEPPTRKENNLNRVFDQLESVSQPRRTNEPKAIFVREAIYSPLPSILSSRNLCSDRYLQQKKRRSINDYCNCQSKIAAFLLHDQVPDLKPTFAFWAFPFHCATGTLRPLPSYCLQVRAVSLAGVNTKLPHMAAWLLQLQ